MSAMTALAVPSSRGHQLDQINAVEVTGNILIDAFIHAQGPIETRHRSLRRFAARHHLTPLPVAVEALMIRMALLGDLMDSVPAIEGEWVGMCEAIARIRLENGKDFPLPWGDGTVSYDAARLQEMIWTYEVMR